MKAMVTKYGGVAGRLGGPMTRAQALRLKGLAQPEQFAPDLRLDEAARRIDVLKAEIANIRMVSRPQCGQWKLGPRWRDFCDSR
jgi:hypothetical protein